MSNIHEVNVTDENLYLELWQYDAGQRLKFVETSIADGSHVLFANSETRKAIRKEVANNEVGIPNKFLRATGKMHITIETFNENEETTLYEINGYIKRRQDGEPGTSPEDEPTFIQKIIQKTIELAQSVRDDADAGEFDGQDGQDGYSPQVTVKTETPSTYVLHIKDADHEFDTPNLQGQGGEGSIEVGDGLQRVGNVISILISEYLSGKKYLKFSGNDDGLYLDFTQLISDGLITPKNYVDNLADALGNALSVSIDTQTYVMTLQLKHNNQVLSTGTVDLPLETMVVDADYDSQTKEIVLTLQSGSTVRFSVADLVSGLVTESDFQDAISDIEDALADKQDKLTEGNGIKIINNVISVDSRIYKLFDLGRGGVLPTDPSSTLGSQVELYDVARVMDNASPYNVHLYLAYSISSTTIDWIDYFEYMGIASNIALGNKQDTIDNTHKLDADNVDDSTSTNKFVTAQEKQGWDDKADDTVISTDTTSTTVSLTLADNHEYRFTQELTALTLTMPSGDFISSIVFASGSTPTSMTYDSNIKWSGDDVTNGQFVPTEKTYNIVMWYDGININGVVRGV